MTVSRTGMPVLVQGPPGVQRISYGFVDDDENYGWSYPKPAVACLPCIEGDRGVPLLDVFSVRAVGGTASVIWNMVCPVCETKISYPATDFSDIGDGGHE